ncbi:EamA family transporter [Pantoea sp. CCBC3-3-1]|uniref:EamA family transporter n=1 Tax=Pantoea sp. CCBC3-3-1 TaxID=2490851 RepID=UPI00143D8758|nr:EamA family transporter [Pantoea sp. CCBC3-3-1]
MVIIAPLSTRRSVAGWVAITLYCIFTSLSAVWVSMSFTKISGAMLTFFTLLIAQIVFLAMSIIRNENPLAFLLKNRLSVFWLNVLTLTSWLFMFMALQRIEASVESAIYQGWIPVIVMILGVIANKKSSTQILGPILIAISVFLLVIVRLYSAENTISTGDMRIIEGVILASVAGGTGGIYVYVSARLKNREGATTVNILTTRFIILLMVTAWLSRNQLMNLVTTDWISLIKLISLSLLFVVIPIFCLQHAILELGAMRVSMLTPLVPAIALGAEYIVSPWHSPWVPVMIGVVSITLIISNFRMNKSVK